MNYSLAIDEIDFEIIEELYKVNYIMPFANRAQESLCWMKYNQDKKAGRKPSWDCEKWEAETNKNLPRRSKSKKRGSKNNVVKRSSSKRRNSKNNGRKTSRKNSKTNRVRR